MRGERRREERSLTSGVEDQCRQSSLCTRRENENPLQEHPNGPICALRASHFLIKIRPIWLDFEARYKSHSENFKWKALLSKI